MKILGTYKNGNYRVIILSDGTKIRYNKEAKLIPSIPESMDIKITNYCDIGCPMCHENSTIAGSHGDILNASFIDMLHPFTELAIGGGNPLSHPDLIPFLQKCKSLKLIPSISSLIPSCITLPIIRQNKRREINIITPEYLILFFLLFLILIFDQSHSYFSPKLTTSLVQELIYRANSLTYP